MLLALSHSLSLGSEISSFWSTSQSSFIFFSHTRLVSWHCAAKLPFVFMKSFSSRGISSLCLPRVIMREKSYARAKQRKIYAASAFVARQFIQASRSLSRLSRIPSCDNVHGPFSLFSPYLVLRRCHYRPTLFSPLSLVASCSFSFRNYLPNGM